MSSTLATVQSTFARLPRQKADLMPASPSMLLITTQTWLQVTRIALRFIRYGARLSVICPEESHLAYAPGVARRFRFKLSEPLRSLHRAILESAAEYLIPADDLAVFFLHELHEQAPELRPLIERSLGDSRFYPLLRSRPQLLDMASSLGIRVPETRVISTEAELDQWYETHAGTCVLKRDGTWGGNGVHIAQTREQASSALASLARGTQTGERILRWLRNGDGAAFARLSSDESSQITVQEYVEGVPANAMFACHRGKVLGSLQARVLVSIGATGPSLVVHILQDERIARAGALLAASLGITGFFGLDFILDTRTGEPSLLELNPRLTRLGHLGMAGGPDLAGLLWHEWTGEPVAPSVEVCAGHSLAFFPDGQRLLDLHRDLPACRIDVHGEEQELLRELAVLESAWQRRPRRRAWLAVARCKKLLRGEQTPQPFVQPAVRETREPGAGPQAVPRKEATTFAECAARLA